MNIHNICFHGEIRKNNVDPLLHVSELCCYLDNDRDSIIMF